MIRALSKFDNTYIYIYYIYEAQNYANDKVDVYYLSSTSNNNGLIVFHSNDIENIEILNNNYIHLKDLDFTAGDKDIIHPVLYDFLKNNWEKYEGIVEGQIEPWLEFEGKLGHRP